MTIHLFRLFVAATVLFTTYTSGYCQNLAPVMKSVMPQITEEKADEPKEAALDEPVPTISDKALEKELEREIVADEKRLGKVEDLQKRSMTEAWTLTMKDLATQNVEMLKQLIDTEKKSKEVQAQNDKLEERLLEMRDNSSEIKKRVETMGLTPAVGALLQKKRLVLMKQELPRKSAVLRRKEIRRVNEEDLRLEGVEDYIEGLSDQKVAEFVEVMNPPAGERNHVKTGMEETFHEATELVHDLRAANAKYMTILGNQSYAERAIKLEAKDYIDFINVKLLWTRSNQSFEMDDISFMHTAVVHFASPTEWQQLASDGLRSLKRDWLQWSVIGLILLVWLVFRVKLKGVIRKMTGKLKEGGGASILASIKGLIASVVVAGVFPLIIVGAVRLLVSIPGCHEFTKAVSIGIYDFARILFIVNLARILLHPLGLAQTYLGWSEPVCRSVRRFAWRCLVFISPLVVVLVTINNAFTIPVRGALGRSLFFVEMIILILILLPLVRARGPIFTHLATVKGFFWNLRRVWLPLAIVVPLTFMVVTFLGYYRTGFLLSFDFLYTIALLGGLIFLANFLGQWSRAAKDEASGKQTAILIRIVVIVLALVGLNQIWSEDIPVVSFLNSVILWSYHAGLDLAQNPIVKSTTLGNLVICGLILTFTYFLTKNLHALLNMLFFKRLRVNQGTQHAVTLIIKYILAVVGFTFALDAIGIGWSKFQWLIAAMTVGLSFGLQEIVANFVSGIILLFERPISVGDTIAVAGVEGKVTKIQIRATTVTDWDNKEVLIPNKALLTTNITNWTLSDQVVRIVIPIGIAYGSDARLAEEILLKVATDNSLTLDKPPASVIFVGFGDSSLDFKLRTYSKSSDRMTTINQLHLEINDAFNSAGLEIPFPQRDLHMDSSKPIEVKVIGKEGGASS